MILALLLSLFAGAVELQTVLDAVEAQHPSVLAALAELDAAEAGRFGAAGGFDPQLSAGAHLQDGPYTHRVARVMVVQPTPLWGAELSAGWMLGDGDFASYDPAKTGPEGAWQARLSVPLLAGRAIDPRRAMLALAAFEQDGAAARLENTRLALARDATLAWVEWRAAGELRALAVALLSQAESRQDWIVQRVAAEDLPAIDVADNRRTLLARRGDLASAEANLTRARAQLALYLRDTNGQGIDAGAPEPGPWPPLPPHLAPPAGALPADAGHPRLTSAAAAVDAADVRVTLAENQRLPKLDAQASWKRDVDALTADPTQLRAGAVLAVPIPQRTARAEADRAEARKTAAEQALRLTADQLAADRIRALAALEAAQARAAWLRESVALAEEVEAAERSRYEAGDSTLLTVVLREQARAEAQAAWIRAEQAVWVAAADLRVALGG